MRRSRLAGRQIAAALPQRRHLGSTRIYQGPPDPSESTSVARRHLSWPAVGIPGQWAGLRTGHFHPGMVRLGLLDPAANPLKPPHPNIRPNIPLKNRQTTRSATPC